MKRTITTLLLAAATVAMASPASAAVTDGWKPDGPPIRSWQPDGPPIRDWYLPG